MIGTTVTTTEPARHVSPLPSVAEAIWGAAPAVVVIGARDRKLTLFSVSVVDETADCVPVDVIAFALSVQAPFLNATTPVVALKAAVLKLSVTGAAEASAPEAGGAIEKACVWTTVSAPPQFMRS